METRYRIEGLRCANCASKMEREISKIPGVESVKISFITGRMTLVSSADLARIEEKASAIMGGIEPGVTIVRV